MLDSLHQRSRLQLRGWERGSIWSPHFLTDGLRRQIPTIALVTGAALAAASAYVMSRSPSYTASTLLLVESRQLHTLPNAVFTTPTPGGPNTQTEIEILKSPKIAQQALGLIRKADPEAALSAPPSRLRALAGYLLGTSRDPISSGTAGMIENLQKHLQVRRVGGTSVVELLGIARTPAGAATIANAVAQAYLADQEAANAAVARSASAWLRDHVKGAGTSTRVLSEALPPTKPDGPRALSILAAALLLGVASGTAAGMGLELVRRRIRTPEEVSALTGLECFGELPTLKLPPGTGRGRWGRLFEASRPSLPSGITSAAESAGFSEAIRRVCVAVTVENAGLFSIGITSPTGGEGKSLVAEGLARSLAASGLRVLLMDATFSNANGASADVVAGPQDTRRPMSRGVDVGTCADGSLHIHSLSRVGSDRHCSFWVRDSASLISELTQQHDIVVVDLPSLQHAAHEIRAAAHRLNGLFLVLEKGRHSPDALAGTLDLIGGGRDRFIGAVLNNGRSKRHRRTLPSHVKR